MRTVERIIFLFVVICHLTSCHDDSVGGYVITDPVDTTQIRFTEAICSGRIKICSGKDVKVKITETGFLYSGNRSEFTDSIRSTQNTNSFNCYLTGLSPDTRYYIRAYAIITHEYARGEVYESIVYGSIKEFATTPIEEEISKFPVPQNLVAEQINDQIVLNWNMPEQEKLIWYVIERSIAVSGPYTGLDTVYNTTFTDKTPLAGTNCYRVKATQGYPPVESEYIYASCDFIPAGGEESMLAPPTEVIAVVTGKSIKVSWEMVSNATDYRIYRSNTSDGDFGNPIARVSSLGYWIDYDPLNGDNYYKVTAFNLYESNFSDCAWCLFP